MSCEDYESSQWDWADWLAAQALGDTFEYDPGVIRRMRPCWVQHIARAIREAYTDGWKRIPRDVQDGDPLDDSLLE